MGLAARGEPGVRFAAYLTVPSAFYLFLLFVCGTLLKLLSPSAFGRSLLLTFPSLFSFGVFRKGGPSQAQLDASSFTFTFIAQGYSRGVHRSLLAEVTCGNSRQGFWMGFACAKSRLGFEIGITCATDVEGCG